jgi:hypothetical protein
MLTYPGVDQIHPIEITFEQLTKYKANVYHGP